MERIAVVGLGYVGMPVAAAFARTHQGTVGFDIDKRRIAELRAGHDRTLEVDDAELAGLDLLFTDDVEELKGCNFFIVTVPTPIDRAKRPDLTAVRAASRTVGGALTKGAVVVYESTVYPGVTEDICVPILEEVSGLKQGEDFSVGYSPERINPGDKVHRLESITKVVSGDTPESLKRIANAYGKIVHAGIHKAPSIKVAEAAKVIENTQRDLNIALMNELALIFERVGIRTADVLDAAATKWNFLRFTPGLVGGHCIGVDPYYITAKAEELGYQPNVILAGRRVNDGMGAHVAHTVIKHLNRAGTAASQAQVGVFGLTFKEDVPDTRNSRVPEIIHELADYGANVQTHDPLADPEDAMHEWGVPLVSLENMPKLDAMVVAVGHSAYVEDIDSLLALLKPGGLLYDVKSAVAADKVPQSVTHLTL